MIDDIYTDRQTDRDRERARKRGKAGRLESNGKAMQGDVFSCWSLPHYKPRDRVSGLAGRCGATTEDISRQTVCIHFGGEQSMRWRKEGKFIDQIPLVSVFHYCTTNLPQT